jgi:hypothetical protein
MSAHTTYHVTLGYDDAGQRLAAGEVGPFQSSTDALTYAVDMLGRTVRDAEWKARPHIGGWDGLIFEDYGNLDLCARAIVRGFTIERYSDDAGTDGSWNIEPVRVKVA